jgi:cellulose synthase/poly-beta-1,6-N-acetylglucosamine synthase-like glycosyltransferase
MSGLYIISGVFTLVAAAYLGLMVVMVYGIRKFTEEMIPGPFPVTKVSVIVPARNEELNLLSCLEDLTNQDYPPGLLEVLLMDDGSTDRTVQIANQFKTDHPGFNLAVYTGPGIASLRPHKKETIMRAVSLATGELILTTDADTRSGRSWILSVAACYEKSRPKMILGPVAFHGENTLFERIQSVEFMALMTATAGLCRAGLPVMCNGANLAYEKEAFTEAGGFDDNEGFPSGDDMFLMSRFRKRYGAGSIVFLWNPNAVVTTGALSRFGDFWQQRIRWVSKNKGYRDVPILSVAIITYLVNVVLFAGLIAGIFNVHLLILTLILLLLKMMVEFPGLYRMSGLLKKRKLLWLFPVVQLLNIVYVSVIGLLGNFLSYKWKGRTN